MANAKVRTNEYNVNVLVETNNSKNQNWCSLNEDVTLLKVLSDREIIELWESRGNDDKLELAKNWIRTQKGYAVSNCIDETLGITYKSIVKYEK